VPRARAADFDTTRPLKQKRGNLDGCPASTFSKASFEPEARIGSAHELQWNFLPARKRGEKFQSRFTRSPIYKGERERSQEEKNPARLYRKIIFDRVNSKKIASRQRPTAMALW
jgi:hypothetical protein